MGTCLFAKPLLGNSCHIFAYSRVIVWQQAFFLESLLSNRVYMLQYFKYVLRYAAELEDNITSPLQQDPYAMLW
jgi:hypothetical protein